MIRNGVIDMAVTVRNLSIGEGVPKICVPIVGRTEEEILSEARSIAEEEPDIIEWRVDFYESVTELEKVKALAGRIRRIIDDIVFLFTFRSVKEGGASVVPVYYYDRMNREIAMDRNVDCIDVELFTDGIDLKNFVNGLKETGVKIVISSHDFFKTPLASELSCRLYKMREIGADILKIAVMPETAADVLMLLKVTNDWKEKNGNQPVITMAMSPKGVISRLTGELFGSAVTFASAGKASAPGQLPIDQMRAFLDFFHENN